MVATYKDYYKILGIERTATEKEIKSAYRRLARKYHPDVHDTDTKKEAEEKFKEINEAYEVLSDPQKRAKYDGLGTGWNHGQEWQPPPGMDGFHFYTNLNTDDWGGFSEFFDILFGRGAEFSRGINGFAHAQALRRQDIESQLELTLEEAYHGGIKKIQLAGYDDSKPKSISVNIPPGIEDGDRIRLKNLGGKGDLYLLVSIKPHPIFTLRGSDIETCVTISPPQAVLGDKVGVPSLDGTLLLTVPPMTHNGQRLRLRGKGWPRKDGKRGDQYVKVNIDIKDDLSQEEKELYQKLLQSGR